MKNNYTLLTGAGGFLGAHHCDTILSFGNSLVMIDIDNKKLDRVKKKLVKKYGNSKIHAFKVDITKEKNVKKLKQVLKRKKIFIQSIINNAAIDSVPKKKFKQSHFVETNQWSKELNVSLLGSYLIIKYFIDLKYDALFK